MKEQWKEFPIGYKSKFRYAVSNHGQLCSFTDNISKGQILKCGEVKGYRIWRYSIHRGQKRIHKHMLIHKLVATVFLPDNSVKQTFVLHMDYNKQNNRVDNLQWATKEEMFEHARKSPAVALGRQRTIEFNRQRAYKLTATKVQFLKRKLSDPNYKTRMKILARQFGITEMQLSRIRRGENWGHIKI